MTEYPAHRKAKERIGTMFAQSHKVEYEKELPCATEQGERNYIADIYLEPLLVHLANHSGFEHFYRFCQEFRPFIIEIDGKEGHSSHKDHAKMKLRDATFRAQGIKTVRLATAWVVGRRALSDADLMAEINWQLSK